MSRDDDLDDEWNRALRIFRGEELEIDESKLESDYDEAVRIHRAAQAPLGMPEEAPSLDDLAAQQAADQAQATAIAPYSRIAPPSLAGAKISGQQLVQSGGSLIQVVDWHGPDEDNMGVTLTLGNVGPPANLPASQATNAWPVPIVGGDYRPYARVTWGAQGIVFVAEVDIPGGAIPASSGGSGGAQSGSSVQLTLGASNVIVQVAMDSGPGGATTYMQLGAALSDLPTQKVSPIFRTRYFDNLSTNATQLIPPCATQLYPVRRDDISKQLLVEIQNCNGTTIDQINVASNVQMAGPLPLPPDAFKVKVTNQTGGSVNVRLPFGLSF